MLNAAGYDCGHFGKWHLNGEFDSPAQPQPGDHGFGRWFATQNNAAPSHRNPTNFVRDGEPVGELDGYSCNLVAAETVRWLDERPDPAAPFYANVWFHEPHLPIASPPELVDAYRDRSRSELEATYFANVANVDRAVGTLLDALDDRGLAGNTIVVFTSDNGPEDRHRYRAAAGAFGSAGDLRGVKLWLYEGGIRVPGIVRWPGRIAPRTDDTPVGAVDLLPTLAGLAGADLPADRHFDGADLGDLLLNGTPPTRTVPLFWLYYRGQGGPVAAVRDGRFVLLGRRDSPLEPLGRNMDPRSMRVLKAETLGRFELYDLAADRAQYRDLFAEKPDVAAELAATLDRLHREVREEGPDWSAGDGAAE